MSHVLKTFSVWIYRVLQENKFKTNISSRTFFFLIFLNIEENRLFLHTKRFYKGWPQDVLEEQS